MNLHLLSFATTIEDIGFQDTELRQLRLHESASRYCRCHHIAWKRKQVLKTDFAKNNAAVFSEPKGAGYWLWKPYIIHEALVRMAEGDYLIYADNAYYFIKSPQLLLPYVDPATGLGMFMDAGYRLKNIIHDEAIRRLGLQGSDLLDCPIVMAQLMVIRKTSFALRLVEEWLELCTQPVLLKDPAHPRQENRDYMFHKHDMALLTYIVAKHGVKTSVAPTLREHEYHDAPDTSAVMVWDKEGFGCRRPVSHYFSWKYLRAFFVRKYTPKEQL